MKKAFVVFVAVILSVIAFSCDHSTDYTHGEFAIYLLADSTMTTGEAMQQPLNSVALSPKPIISIDDIISYKWQDHSFSLKPGADDELRAVVERRQSVRGIPFVVVAEGDRIYFAAFWFAYSSIAPTCPTIFADFLFIAEDTPSLTIQKPWVGDEPDMRNDPRIYRGLKAAGVLIE
jgi:hypothetical protein